jgi:hypothetical protein
MKRNFNKKTNSDSANFTENDWFDFVQSLEESHECPICLESFNLKSNKLVKSCCNHHYCKLCYEKINICSICRSDLKKNKKKIQSNFQPTIQTNIQPNIQINGPNRFVEEGSYFNYVQTHPNHINTYSFALRPEDHQPSGTANFSRIDNVNLNIINGYDMTNSSLNDIQSDPYDNYINNNQTSNPYFNNIHLNTANYIENYQMTNPINLNQLINQNQLINLNQPINSAININNLNFNPIHNRIVIQEPIEMDMANQRMVSELKRLTGNDQIFARELYDDNNLNNNAHK